MHTIITTNKSYTLYIVIQFVHLAPSMSERSLSTLSQSVQPFPLSLSLNSIVKLVGYPEACVLTQHKGGAQSISQSEQLMFSDCLVDLNR